jgi:iron(III) transport system ATP-binding protein
MRPLALAAEAVTRAVDGRTILEGASLTAPIGQVSALLGASGAGKSSLLRILAGLDGLDGGIVRLGERILSAPGRIAPPETRDIGLVFQDYALFPHLTAAQNVAFGLSRRPAAERARIAREGLTRVGLAHRADAYPHELSGGEQQRIALARALAPEPAAVLLDEPFSSLDPGLRAEVREATFAALRATGVTVLLVTHDADEALAVGDWIAVMHAGRVDQEGPPQELYARPKTLAAASALGALNIWRGGPQSPFGLLPNDGRA